MYAWDPWKRLNGPESALFFVVHIPSESPTVTLNVSEPSFRFGQHGKYPVLFRFEKGQDRRAFIQFTYELQSAELTEGWTRPSQGLHIIPQPREMICSGKQFSPLSKRGKLWGNKKLLGHLLTIE